MSEKEVSGVDAARVRLAEWGVYYRNQRGPGARGYGVSESTGAGSDECAVPVSVDEVEAVLCELKRNEPARMVMMYEIYQRDSPAAVVLDAVNRKRVGCGLNVMTIDRMNKDKRLVEERVAGMLEGLSLANKMAANENKS